MQESIILGAIQGVAEWLPISSEGAIAFVQNRFFDQNMTLGEVVRYALFLHAGTFASALVYFWRDVVRIVHSVFAYTHATREEKSLVRFLAISTIATGAVGGLFLFGLDRVALSAVAGRTLMFIIAAALFMTAFLQWRVKARGRKDVGDTGVIDALVVGIAQGFTVLPGLSRSGTTVALLLLRNVQDTAALRLSFLMSLPVVLGANIVLNAGEFANLTVEGVAALAAAFGFGFATIHVLLLVAKRVNFALFVFIFALLVAFAALFPG